MHEAFGWSLETFLAHGGYPGAAGLVDQLDDAGNTTTVALRTSGGAPVTQRCTNATPG